MAPESAWPAHLRMHAEPATTSPAASSRLVMLERQRRELAIRVTADGYVSAKGAALLRGRRQELLKKWRYENRGPPFRKINSQIAEYSIVGLAAYLDEISEISFD